jgi:ElaB/YqjD/DUF883 family membrane-anchored ribosome-binding protein
MANVATNTTAKKDLRQVGEDAGRTLRENAEEVGSNVRRFVNENSELVSEKAHELREEAERRITAHPLQAVGIAALAGLAFGLLIRR